MLLCWREPLWPATCSLVLVLLLPYSSSTTTSNTLTSSERCTPDSLAIYRVLFEAFWTKKEFPKQYPEFRPPAQWSKLIGRSHDETFRLFEVGSLATAGLKEFAERGRAEGLEREAAAAKDSVFDEFVAAPVERGTGHTEADLFVDGNHTRVSIVVRLVPSPDWFVGLDSASLCPSGYWLNSGSFTLGPLDAGTDAGFTFTAPDWPNIPPVPVSHITAREPNHPANSFFYPNKERLPRLAKIYLYRERVYHLTNGLSSLDLTSPVESSRRKSDLSNDVVPQLTITSQNLGPKRKNNKHKRRGPQPCQVSKWSAWGICSATCGGGEEKRQRKILKPARRGGSRCPHLEETRWCGKHGHCNQTFFRW